MKTIAKFLSLFLILNMAIPTLIAGGETHYNSNNENCDDNLDDICNTNSNRKKKRSPNYVSGFFNTLAACATGYAAYEFFNQARNKGGLFTNQTTELYNAYVSPYLNTSDKNKNLILKVGRGGTSAIFGALALIFGSKAIKQLGLIQ